MIRKLKSGQFRLYSRKKNPKQGNAGIWEHSKVSKQLSIMNGLFNFLSDIDRSRTDSTKKERLRTHEALVSRA